MKAIASPPASPLSPSARTPRALLNKGTQAVTDLDQLIAKILTLQPHDQVELVLSPGNTTTPHTDGEPSDSPEQRGFLMEIRVGLESSLCVKRTF